MSGDALSGLKPKAAQSLDPSVFEELDAEQMGGFSPRTLRKLDGEQVDAIPSNAFAGMTPNQGRKMNQVVASNFDPAQIRSIQPECLASLPDPVFRLLEGDLSASQLNGLEAL